MKVCRWCGRSKPVADFGGCKANKNGLLARCRPCAAEQRKKHMSKYYAKEENRERKARYDRVWHKKNAAYMKLWRSRYKENNPAELIERGRKSTADLVDSYVAAKLGAKVGDVPQELIDLKRSIIILGREILNVKRKRHQDNREPQIVTG